MKYTKEEIRGFLETVQNSSPEQIEAMVVNGKPAQFLVYRMLQALNERQTADERAQEITKYNNNRGFQPGDAKLMGSIANRSKQWGSLTPKQARLVARRITKYSGQLERVAKENMQAKGSIPSPVPVAAPTPPVVAQKGDPNAQWVQHKIEFAKLEAQQEQQAFMNQTN